MYIFEAQEERKKCVRINKLDARMMTVKSCWATSKKSCDLSTICISNISYKIWKRINKAVIPHTFVRLNSNASTTDVPSKLSLGPSPTIAHSLRPSSIEGHPIYYGPKSNAFIRQAFQRDDQVEREKGCRGEKKRCAYGRVKKKNEDEKPRDADGWRATIESLVSRLRKLPEELPEALQLGRA